MSNLAIPATAAFVGSFFGPYGATIGWMVGSAYQSSKEKIDNTTTIGDLRVQTSQYGSAIPLVIGKQRLAGNIIWAQEKKTYKIEESVGKGGPEVVSTGYTVTLAIMICKGDIAGVRRVWADGKLIIDSTATAKPLIGELYLGTNTQTPDPTIESFEGVGNTPAYRGISYIVLTDYDLGQAGRIPNFSFEVVKEGGL